jgi:carboxylate-amine ligase
MAVDFKPSETSSIGVELEFQLLDPVTFDLVDGVLPLLERCSGNPHIIPEYNQATVEINTRICGDAREMEGNVISLASTIRENCRDLGMVISGGGTHPFCSRFAKVTPIPRFLAMERVEGYIGYTSTTYALHVHIGMSNGEETIAVMKSLRSYLPLLLALSASSPFWWGNDSGFASYRQRVLSSLRTYGIPPYFENWEEFCRFSESARRAGLLSSFEDIHWDIRPRPDIGTLELRAMDSQPTIKEAVMLSSFVRVLVEYIRRRYRAGQDEGVLRPLPLWVERENHYQATHKGLDAIIIEDASGNTGPIRKVIEDTIKAVTGTAKEMGEEEYLRQLECKLDSTPSYVRQRMVFKETGSTKEVAASLVKEMEDDLVLYCKSDI